MSKETRLVLLIGAPSTGKTSVLKKLSDFGYPCLEEVSREIVQEARQEGITHLFQSDPLLFSQKLLEKRMVQYHNAKKINSDVVFIDRGLPDITAYLDMVKTNYPVVFRNANEQLKYDQVFWFPVWKSIHTSDEERYEDFELAKSIQKHLIEAYSKLNYDLIEVPKLSVDERVDFILSNLENL
jgi:predicted ATPase